MRAVLLARLHRGECSSFTEPLPKHDSGTVHSKGQQSLEVLLYTFVNVCTYVQHMQTHYSKIFENSVILLDPLLTGKYNI